MNRELWGNAIPACWGRHPWCFGELQRCSSDYTGIRLVAQ